VKALTKVRAQRGLWLEEVAEPEAGINDVKTRVLSTGICGTDLHIYEWDEWARSTIIEVTVEQGPAKAGLIEASLWKLVDVLLVHKSHCDRETELHATKDGHRES
jgi:hypothetical protein